MVKIQIHRKNKKRRDGKGFILLPLLFFVLFPYIISSFSNVEKQALVKEDVPGQIYVLEKKIWGGQKIPLEEYLKGMLAATIPAEYEEETLKAQAIILRSFCANRMKKENGMKVIYDDEIKEYYFTKQNRETLWEENKDRYWQKIENAVNETKGIVLVCNGDIVKPPFCRISNGKTRDITEYVVRKDNYGYMKTVECTEDKLAKEYIGYMEIPQKEFKKIIRKLVKNKTDNVPKIILLKDVNDYVKEIQIGEQKIDGERFRKAFGIKSSSFSLDKINDMIEIRTEGIGHGFGFSQYEANQLALKGKDYVYLLNQFFSDIFLEKI